MQDKGDGPGIGAYLVFMLGGALLGAALWSWAGGLAIGAALGYLLAQILYLRAAVCALRSELAQGSRPADLPATLQSPPAAAPPERFSVPRQVPVTVPTAAASPAAPPATPSVPRPTLPPRAPAPASALDLWLARAIAWFKRGNPMARIGIVILFFGGAFLAKYSAERGLLPPELRLGALGLGAVALVLLGWRMRARRPGFAQILQGGGIAGLYLTLFAATKLYALLPPGLALPLLIGVALSGAVLAVAQSALALAVIGFSGGFLAPILLSTGSGNHVALFTYYTVLNLGIFAVAWFRAWRVLNLLGFVFTFGIASTFRALAYLPEKQASTDFFVLLFFAMYVAISILFSLRQKPDLKGYVSGSLVFGLPVVAFALHATLVRHIEFALAYSALGFGVLYVTLAWALLRSGRDNLRLLGEAFAALAVIFCSLAIPLAFDGQATAAMWAVEGAGLVWLGLRQGRALARAFGCALQLFGGIAYLGDLQGLAHLTPVLNSAWIGSLMLATGGLCSGLWLHRDAAALKPYESALPFLLGLWGALWWLLGGIGEIDRSVSADFDYGAVLAFAALSSAGFHVLARALRWPLPDRFAILLLPLAAVAGVLCALGHGHPFVEGGWLAWPLALATVYALLHRWEAQPLAPLLAWLHAGAWWLLAVVLSWESSWQIGQQLDGVWQRLPWGLVPALLIWLTARTLPPWPVAARLDNYRIGAAAPLAALAALWVLGISLSDPGTAEGLPYLPLLNPLDLSIALVLGALAQYWTALTPAQRTALAVPPHAVLATFAGLAFIWLTTTLVRSLHQLAGTPWDIVGIRHSFLVQASLSLFWGLLGLALIVLAARRAQRVVWIAGAALMAVVVAKLFLIDLEGRGSLARIVSFLGVGGLLLLAGYLSPLPPATAQREATA